MLASFCHVVSELHPEKVVHVGAESFLDAKGHLPGRERHASIRKYGRDGRRLIGGSPRMLTAGERYAAVVGEVLQQVPSLRGSLWHDAETAVLMKEHGIRRIYTRDVDFHRFRFLEVVDPTR